MQAIASLDHLKSYITSLNTEICRVWEHWSVLKGIHGAADDYSREMNESGQFWRITSRALQDVVVVRLAVLVDPKDDVVSMPKFLRLLREQAELKTAVLPISRDALDELKIDDDIKAVYKDDMVVRKVRRLRNKIVAHRDMSIVVRNATQELPELPDAEIEALIRRLHAMIFKYCRLAGMNPIVLSFPGEDDYKSLLGLLRSGFDAMIAADDQQYQDFCRRIGKFLMEFSQLEFTIRAALSAALKLPTQYSGLVTGNFEYANLCGVTAAVLIDQEPEKKEEIEKLYNDCKQLGSHRNALAHSLLTHDGAEERFMGVNQSRQSLGARDLFANDELERFTAQAQALMQRVLGFTL